MHRAFPAALAVAITACGPALPNDTTAGGGDGMSSGAADSVSASGGDSGSGDSTGSGDSGGSGNTQPNVDPTVLEMACIDALRNTLACGDNNDDSWILQQCADQALVPAACHADLTAYWNCFGTLSCEQLDILPSPCSEFEHAASANCQWGTCKTGMLGWPKGCEFTQFCDDVDHRITCAQNQCTCFLDEQPVAECDQGSICDGDPGAQQACCGFTVEF